MSWLPSKQRAAALLLAAAAPLGAAAVPPPACPSASATTGNSAPCPRQPAPTVLRPATPAPGVNQQVTLYCGAATSASAPSDPRPATVPDCKKGSDAAPSKVSVKLAKGIGIDFESGDTALSYLFVVLAVLLITSALWLAAEKVTGGDGPGIAGLLLVGLVVFGLGGLLGYWWKGDRVTTLKAHEVDQLLKSQAFAQDLQRALLESAQVSEERDQLKARIAALEQDLAVARAKADDGGRAGPADWTAVLAGLIGLVAGATGLAGAWHRARLRTVRLEAAVMGAVHALTADLPWAEADASAGREQRIHTALQILRPVERGRD